MFFFFEFIKLIITFTSICSIELKIITVHGVLLLDYNIVFQIIKVVEELGFVHGTSYAMSKECTLSRAPRNRKLHFGFIEE